MTKILSILSIFVLMLSCANNNSQNNNQVVDKKQLNDLLIEKNIDMLSLESQLIDEYIMRNNLDVIKTGTGLRYQILYDGDGEFVKKGDVVTIEYEIRLLNDEILYSSEKEGNKTFVVGRGGVESGLEEAVLKLKRFSEAILILPSHLAYGIIGDGDKIPHRSVLIYKVKIIDINN